MAAHTVASVDDIPEGEGFGTVVDGVEIAVFNVDGEYYAIHNKCIHKEGPMYRGHVDDESCSVFCPWHWWEWDLETGRSPVDTKKRLRTFDVEVEDGEVRIDV